MTSPKKNQENKTQENETQKNRIWIEADWPTPKHIRAGTTLRTGGHSQQPYDELNLALHVNDNPEDVKKNRSTLIENLHLQSEPVWLNQIHSSKIICINNAPENLEADASYTTEKNKVCSVMTADCVPVLFCNQEGTKVAAVHAGWRGICGGIVENSIKTLASAESLLAWIGPCISANHYEVGKEVYESCTNHSTLLEKAFEQRDENHWSCDLVKIINILLKNCGVGSIYECNLCTYEKPDLFFSYRRDGDTGRTASMIWME
ncbi:MAG: peptidoglycan editing factor PgeF [Gammaproteobacteria bacterium]|jgi:YfiH family protein